MAYQIENLKLAESAKIKVSHMAWVIILALLIGLGAAYWTHLTAYYQFGANVLEGGTSEGGWRVGQSVNKNTELVAYSKSPKLPDYNRTVASGAGFAIAIGLAFLRMIFLKFPLHPFGYAVAASLGDYFWGPFLAVWIIKLVILKLGGIKLYKKLITGFIGLALGHYFTGGVIAEFLGFFGGEAFRRYHIG